MNNSPGELKLPRRIVLRIISLLGNPDRNDQECMVEAEALRRTLAQSKSGN